MDNFIGTTAGGTLNSPKPNNQMPWPPVGIDWYYHDNAVAIAHGDCRDILPNLPKVDLVLTDPPYGIDGPTTGMQRQRKKCEYHTDTFEDTVTYLSAVVIPIIQWLIHNSPAVILTPGNRHFGLYPQPDSFGVFYQPSAVAVQRFGNLDAQPIFYYGSNQRNQQFGIPLSWKVTESPEKNGHPCPKPIRAWMHLLHSVSLPGHLVLDPFMGSGTTLVAAQTLGRKSIGIDIEEKYCQIAVERLRQKPLPFTITEQPSSIRTYILPLTSVTRGTHSGEASEDMQPVTYRDTEHVLSSWAVPTEERSE